MRVEGVEVRLDEDGWSGADRGGEKRQQHIAYLSS